MKIKLIPPVLFCLALFSCEQHTDYQKIKLENKQLKRTVGLLKVKNAQLEENERLLRDKEALTISPFAMVIFENNSISKGDKIKLEMIPGAYLKNQKVSYILKDNLTGKFTDKLTPTSDQTASKTFRAEQSGQFKIEGLMIYQSETRQVTLPFEKTYNVIKGD